MIRTVIVVLFISIFLICSIPIQYKDRPRGSYSKLNTYRDGAKVLLTIFN